MAEPRPWVQNDGGCLGLTSNMLSPFQQQVGIDKNDIPELTQVSSPENCHLLS